MIKHLSFSAIKDLHECAYRFKLRYVDKIPSFANSIDTIFGTIIHNNVQDYLLGKIEKKAAMRRFHRTWRTFYRLYKKNLNAEKVTTFLHAGLNILNHMDTAFDAYKALVAEERLEIPISDERPEINFKGFIDLVLEAKIEDDSILIVDLKTSKSAYTFRKYLDTIKKYQLTWYKHYYSKKYDIPPENIRVAFVVLEKDPKSKNPIQFIEETSGPKKIKNSLELINKSLRIIDSGNFVRNRTQCSNEFTGISCPFYKTPHCSQGDK